MDAEKAGASVSCNGSLNGHRRGTQPSGTRARARIPAPIVRLGSGSATLARDQQADAHQQ